MSFFAISSVLKPVELQSFIDWINNERKKSPQTHQNIFILFSARFHYGIKLMLISREGGFFSLHFKAEAKEHMRNQTAEQVYLIIALFMRFFTAEKTIWKNTSWKS